MEDLNTISDIVGRRFDGYGWMRLEGWADNYGYVQPVLDLTDEEKIFLARRLVTRDLLPYCRPLANDILVTEYIKHFDDPASREVATKFAIQVRKEFKKSLLVEFYLP